MLIKSIEKPAGNSRPVTTYVAQNEAEWFAMTKKRWTPDQVQRDRITTANGYWQDGYSVPTNKHARPMSLKGRSETT